MAGTSKVIFEHKHTTEGPCRKATINLKNRVGGVLKDPCRSQNRAYEAEEEILSIATDPRSTRKRASADEDD